MGASFMNPLLPLYTTSSHLLSHFLYSLYHTLLDTSHSVSHGFLQLACLHLYCRRHQCISGSPPHVPVCWLLASVPRSWPSVNWHQQCAYSNSQDLANISSGCHEQSHQVTESITRDPQYQKRPSIWGRFQHLHAVLPSP